MSDSSTKVARLLTVALFSFLSWTKAEPSAVPSDYDFTEGRKHWAYQPVASPTPPAVSDPRWAKTPIDRFIFHSLATKGLRPVQTADKRTLIRRATFDLIGLPPTPKEIANFLADDSPRAFARVIDRLLESPHYGERWGRHWLDVARYADSNGLDENIGFPNAFRYRDYVVNSFNKDKPYNVFLTEQLAGDLMPHTGDAAEQSARITATGFLVIGAKLLAEQDEEKRTMDIIDEQLSVLSQAFMGQTVGCARCHDHFFDPIPTSDYYALAGILRSTVTMRKGKKDLPVVSERDLPGEGSPKAMAVAEDKATDLPVHIRGDHLNLDSTSIPRGFLRITDNLVVPPQVNSKQSGRLQLAQWLTHKDHPLTARVMVNRIWQGHFGRGLVATPNNFGTRGEKPVHPELLDYLARVFMEENWSIKAMHRHIMLSQTYQLSSASEPKNMKIDPENRLHWRKSRQRLQAEVIRDALLAMGGTLDLKRGGKLSSYNPDGYVLNEGKAFGKTEFYQSRRRSIYLPVIRNALPDLFTTFDYADAAVPMGRRPNTIVAPQALLMMNSPFVVEQAGHFAKSLLTKKVLEDKTRLQEAYLKAYGRPPTQAEAKDALMFLDDVGALQAHLGEEKAELETWKHLCHVIMAASEFIYVD